jgi:hypothetical protein
MKKILTLFAAIIMTSSLLAPCAFSQPQMGWRGSCGWGQGSKYGRLYNPDTVETFSGSVLSVERVIPVEGMSYGVHLVLQTDKEPISVHLGPAWYIEYQDMKIEPNDNIEVKGSRIAHEGKPAIIAAEVTKGENVLMLRDANGFPVWSGWRRR